MHKEICDFETYLGRMLDVQRPGADNILSFYEHRVGSICTDARLLLAPLDDHLCHRGDGVFESISYRSGKLFHLQAHMVRMQNSAAGLKIIPPCSWQEIEQIILEVAAAAVKRSGLKDGAVRILLGRGPGGFGVSPAECPISSLYVIALKSNIPTKEWYAKGLTACRSAIPAKQAYLAKLKNTNYLPNVLMAEEALDKKVDVAFSFTEEGYLAETAVANVALVNNENILVCPKLNNILSGTTLMAALNTALLPVRFEDILEEDIWKAKEVLLFGSTPICVSVVSYEGRAIGNGEAGEIANNMRVCLLENFLAEGTSFE